LFSVGIITVSDKGAAGEREDLSGPEIKKIITTLPAEVKAYEIVPDNKETISNKIKELIDDKELDIIITTGGTGVSSRDVTPEATREVIEKEIPGMAEVMRMESLKKTPHAMISRAVVGIRHHSLIVNLPGRTFQPYFPPFPILFQSSRGMKQSVLLSAFRASKMLDTE